MAETPSPDAITRADLRRATWMIIAAIAVATVVLILTIRNSAPDRECAFLLERIGSGTATEEEFARSESLDCGGGG